MTSLYDLQAPTTWATAPATWSSTTLDDVSACPRRWQLLHSRWGEYEHFPVRHHPAAIEGQIVHEALDRLARACGKRGNPPFGSPLFTEAAAEASFFDGFAAAIADWQERLARHPRPGPVFRLRTSAQELTNRAVRLFRDQYRPGNATTGASSAKLPEGAGANLAELLRRKRVLTEVRIRHNSLPFIGVLDRVGLNTEGVEVVDFKTGKPSDAHREQLIRYAVLWWRLTGEAPIRVRAQYLHGDSAWNVDPASLAACEEHLRTRIAELTDTLAATPSLARPGLGCKYCPVRARCIEGWAHGESFARSDGRGDAQLTVASSPGTHGFLTTDAHGADVTVVYEAVIIGLLPKVKVGQVVRVIDGVWRDRGKEIEIKAWTEVFVE